MRNAKGYGLTGHHGAVLAHRLAAHLWLGFDIKSPLCVLHRCDNPPCVNPAHLWTGTVVDNQRDMAAKGRSGRAKLTADQVREIRAVMGDPGRRRFHGLSARYGVDKATIQRIGKGLIYRWVS